MHNDAYSIHLHVFQSYPFTLRSNSYFNLTTKVELSWHAVPRKKKENIKSSMWKPTNMIGPSTSCNKPTNMNFQKHSKTRDKIPSRHTVITRPFMSNLRGRIEFRGTRKQIFKILEINQKKSGDRF